jgi:hypothetical protein
MQKIALFFLGFFCFTQIHSQVVINEYSAANYSGINFPGAQLEFEDWIELYNTSASTVNLSSYYLSDKLNNLQKWQFPTGVTIPANGRLVVLASSLNSLISGYQNTNFKLTQTSGNEFIILSNPLGVIIDSVSLNYPNQINQSRGRVTDGAATWGIFDLPTMGTANSNAKTKYADKAQFNLAPGFYTGAQSITLSTTEPASSIRYTLNGSEPTASSTLYTGPINIANTRVLRAKVFSTNANILPSHTETNTYFINENHSVKVVSVCGNTLFDLFDGNQIEPQGSFELFETDGTFLTEATGEFNKHGNDSWAYDQRGVDFIARDQFGINFALEDEIFDTKNRDEFQKVILKCGASDNYPFEPGGAHIRDAYINEMSQLGDLRLDERSNEFAVLYLNGTYWGVYDIREKTDDTDFTSYYYDQDEPFVQYLKTWGGTWEEYGAPNAQPDWDAFVSFVDMNDMTIQSNYDYVDSVYNTGSLIDYFILNGFVVCADWLNWNTGWWRGLDPNGDKQKWRYTLWDMDATFGHYINYTGVPSQNANADPCDPESLGDPGDQGHVPIWNKLQTNDEFFADYINRYAELTSSVFTCDSMHNLLDRMVGEIEPEMQRHINRWGGTMAEWESNVQDIHDFIDTRCVNVPAGLVNCNPEISGPYELTINVNPPLSGEVQLSSITPSTYPYVGTYFGGVNITLDADAFTGWTFDYWTIENDTIFPSVNDENIFLTLSADDTIVAHFVPDVAVPMDTLTFIVVPVGAGNISINGALANTFPFTNDYNQNTLMTLSASPNSGYTFANWAMNNHSPAPSNTASSVSITHTTNDTIYAYFDLIPPVNQDTIVYLVNPVGSGSITINGINASPLPFTQISLNGALQNISANANANFAFSYWEASTSNLANINSANTSFPSVTNDTIIAHFVQTFTDSLVVMMFPNGAGSLQVGSDIITNTPFTGVYTLNQMLNIEASSPNGTNFNRWELNNQSLPDYSEVTSFLFINQDTLFAYFDAPTFIQDLGEDLSSFVLYPSVNDGNFQVRYQTTENIAIMLSLFNLEGKLIKTWDLGNKQANNSYTNELQFEGSNGMYLLHIHSNKSASSEKLMKIKY